MQTTLILTCAALFWAVAQKPDPLKDEVRKLQGTWRLEKYLMCDPADATRWVEVAPDEIRRRHLVIKGASWVSHVGQNVYQMNWTVDPSKNPKHLNLKTTVKGQEQIRPCIYRLTGDVLVVCLPLGEKGQRPTKFDAPDGVGVQFYKRERLE